MKAIAKQSNLDALIFGHTSTKPHASGRKLFINLGSPTNPLPAFTTRLTAALLKITKEEILPEIIRF